MRPAQKSATISPESLSLLNVSIVSRLTVSRSGGHRTGRFLGAWLAFTRRQILADDVLGHVVLLLDLLLHYLLDNVRLHRLLVALDGRDQFLGLNS